MRALCNTNPISMALWIMRLQICIYYILKRSIASPIQTIRRCRSLIILGFRRWNWHKMRNKIWKMAIKHLMCKRVSINTLYCYCWSFAGCLTNSRGKESVTLSGTSRWGHRSETLFLIWTSRFRWCHNTTGSWRGWGLHYHTLFLAFSRDRCATTIIGSTCSAWDVCFGAWPLMYKELLIRLLCFSQWGFYLAYYNQFACQHRLLYCLTTFHQRRELPLHQSLMEACT